MEKSLEATMKGVDLADALRAIAARCDGAVERDDRGFNGHDTHFAVFRTGLRIATHMQLFLLKINVMPSDVFGFADSRVRR